MTSREPINGIAVIDLFAGAGGLAIGAEQAGCDVRLSTDNDKWSCQTLAANHDHSVLEADVTTLSGAELRDRAELGPGAPLIVVGGPPCQPFSKAAYWVEDGADAAYRRARAAGEKAAKPEAPTVARPDGRRTLVQEFWRLVIECEADGFVFENVRSITHPRNRPILDQLIADAQTAGFQTTLYLANAVDHGVPQLRQRVFLMGSRECAPISPVRTHALPEHAIEEGLEPFVTAGAVLAPFSGSEFFEDEEIVEGKWAEHLRTVPPGGNYKAHTAWGGHPNPTFVTETRFWNFLLKLSPDRPSWTIAASPGPWTGPFHWESRRLRTSEFSALQTFPPDYRFAGSRRECVRQIGNAVPPLLGSQIIAGVVATLDGAANNAEPQLLAS